MINTTATTLSVKGNGNLMGFNPNLYEIPANDGLGHLLSIGAGNGWYNVGITIGTVGFAQHGYKLSTDASKTGIVANMPATIAPTKWVIKY